MSHDLMGKHPGGRRKGDWQYLESHHQGEYQMSGQVLKALLVAPLHESQLLNSCQHGRGPLLFLHHSPARRVLTLNRPMIAASNSKGN